MKRRGIKTIIAGLMIFIFGLVIVPLLFIAPLIFGKSNDVQFKVPGIFQANAEKPGRYYLCNDYQTIFDGKTYDCPTNLPGGMEIEIFGSNGQLLHLISDTSFSSSNGSSAKKSIGYVDVENTGKIRIEVSGESEEKIFSFGPLNFWKYMGLFLGAFALFGLVALGGITITIWGIVKLVKSNK